MLEMQEDRQASWLPSGSVVGLAGRYCCVAVEQADRQSQSVVLSAVCAGGSGVQGSQRPQGSEGDFLEKVMHQLETCSGL